MDHMTASKWPKLRKSAVIAAVFGIILPFTLGHAVPVRAQSGTVTANTLQAVDCASPTFCVAVGALGTILQYNGTSWSAQSSGTTNGLVGVTCLSSSFCEAVGGNGTILNFNGTSWVPQSSGTSNLLLSVACSNPSFCFAAGNNGTVQQFNGTAWSSQSIGTTSQIGGVSCASSTFCAAAAACGIFQYDGSNWTQQTISGSSRDCFSTVDCPVPSFCLAGGNDSVLIPGPDGVIAQYNGSTWTALPAQTTNVGAPRVAGLFCLSSSFCVSVSSLGDVSLFNGTSWSFQKTNNSNPLDGVACGGPSVCFAVGANGTIVQYNGTSWSVVQTAGTGLSVIYPAGENLISGPPGTVVSGAQGPLYTYQAADSGYETIAAGTPLQAGLGYWADFAAPTTVILAPAQSLFSGGSITVPLPAGHWIMVGNPWSSQATLSGADAIFTYDPVKGYAAAISLAPGQGAWAISVKGGTLTIMLPPVPVL